MRRVRSVIMAAFWLSLLAASGAAAADLAAGLVSEEFMVDAAQPGIQLYVRNKHPADMAQVPGGRVLLYVHGATQPSEATFDLPLDGLSWMDYIASHGWDVYLMDARGYGRSTRSPDLAQPSATQAPIVWTDTKVQDASSVIDFILKRRSVPKLTLMGWSWGTIVVAAYAAGHEDKVSGLVLYAPVWCAWQCDFDSRSAETLAEAHAGSHESAAVVLSSMAGARKRFQSGAPPDRIDELMPPAWFAAWSAADLATDPVGATLDPPAIRVPAGVSQDSSDYWNVSKSYYDPKKITVPSLTIVAEWDAVTPPSGAHNLYEALANSPGRRFVELKEGTHIIMLEKNRMQLFDEVQRFLDDSSPAP
jgi:pimeloyl-ACP methyl ester carboxylesterase